METIVYFTYFCGQSKQYSHPYCKTILSGWWDHLQSQWFVLNVHCVSMDIFRIGIEHKQGKKTAACPFK